MAQNRIQFQKSLSLPEFLKKYGSEAQCAAALEKMRWPEGYQTARGAEETASAAGQLAQQSQEFQSLVSRFRLV